MTEEDLHHLYLALAHCDREQPADAERLDQLASEARARQADPVRRENWQRALDDCVHAVAASNELIGPALSKWFTVDTDVPLARLLLTHIDQTMFERTKPIELPLQGVSRDDAILVAFRLCSCLTPVAFSLGWLFSSIRAFPKDEKVLASAETLLRHHADEYLYTTHAMLIAEESPFLDLPEAQAAAAAVKALVEHSDTLPQLREFAATPAMKLQLAMLKRSEQRQIERGARDQSIFAQLFTSKRVKYATRVAVQIVDGDTVRETTLGMARQRIAMELPLTAVTDPMSGELRRRKLWRGTKA